MHKYIFSYLFKDSYYHERLLDNLEKDLDNFEVEGFDTEGQSVFVKSAMDMKENELLKIDIASLSKGIYLLQIVSNGLNYTRKFVKE